MGNYKTEITHDDYLRALALFVMANAAYCESARYAEALNKIIMEEPEQFPGGHVDDAIYENQKQNVAAFNAALRLEGIKVAKPLKSPPKKRPQR